MLALFGEHHLFLSGTHALKWISTRTPLCICRSLSINILLISPCVIRIITLHRRLDYQRTRDARALLHQFSQHVCVSDYFGPEKCRHDQYAGRLREAPPLARLLTRALPLCANIKTAAALQALMKIPQSNSTPAGNATHGMRAGQIQHRWKKHTATFLGLSPVWLAGVPFSAGVTKNLYLSCTLPLPPPTAAGLELCFVCEFMLFCGAATATDFKTERRKFAGTLCENEKESTRCIKKVISLNLIPCRAAR